jgi:hypothetical protein
VISSERAYDGTVMRLHDALEHLSEGFILVCVPARLAFYVGEGDIDQWIIKRRA